jgi:hypothetical protein
MLPGRLADLVGIDTRMRSRSFGGERHKRVQCLSHRLLLNLKPWLAL